MNRDRTLITVLTFGLVLAAAPAFAQRGLGVGGALGGHAGINAGSGAATAAGQVSSGAGVKTNAGAQAGASTQANTSAGAKSGTAAGAAGAGIVTRIDDNPQLAARVQSMLPTGESISTAAAGFKNEGQFLAALNVSQNLNIPFDDLKAKMTGSDSMSLGAAIHALKPGISAEDAKEQVKKAERQAKEAERQARDAKKDADDDKAKAAASTATTTNTAISTH